MRTRAVTGWRVAAACLLGAVGVVVALGEPPAAEAGGALPASEWAARGVFPPVLGSVTGVSCATASTCVAVGRGEHAVPPGSPALWVGVALRTVDGGHVWSSEALPQGVGALEAVDCPTARRCEATTYSPGVETEILGSDDGGQHWHVQYDASVDPYGALLAISCSSAAVCLATGDGVGGGSVLATSDGGARWLAITPFTSLDPVDVTAGTCPTAATCEIVGNLTSAIDVSSPVAARTTNGGVTWMPQVVPAGVGKLVGLSCATALSCEAAALSDEGTGEMLHTADGGTTWITQAVPAASIMASVQCTSTVDCVAVGSSADAKGARGVVVTTTDDGSTWSRRLLPVDDAKLLDVSSRSLAECVLVGVSPTQLALYVRMAGTALAVRDFPADRGVVGMATLACPTPLRCVAVGSNSTGTITRGTLHVSMDQGRTWHQRYLDGAAVLSSVVCPTAMRCFALGGDSSRGLLYGSTTSGASWHVLSRTPAGLDEISCATASHCLVGGRDVLLRTDDAARTWVDARPRGASWDVTSLSCPTASECVAGVESPSGRSSIVRTDDDARAWRTVRAVPLDVLSSISCPTPEACVATGGAALDAQGAAADTWAATAARGSPLARSASRHASSGGDGAFVLYSTDGGLHWAPGVVPATAMPLVSAGCTGPSVCLAATVSLAGPSLLATSDGGRSWHAVAAPPMTSSVSEITCGAAGCWIIGSTEAGSTILERER